MNAEVIADRRLCSGKFGFFITDIGKEFVLKSASVEKSHLVVVVLAGGLRFQGAKSYAIAVSVDES